MTQTDLDRDLVLPLLYEVESAASLLSGGVTLLWRADAGQHEPSPIFATLAAGAEKLLKLSIGLLAVTETGEWPPLGDMQRRGHGILAMHVETLNGLRRRLRDPMTSGTAALTLTTLRQDVIDDPVLTLTLRSLSAFANDDGCHNLDRLAAKDGIGPSPKQRWDDLERGIQTENHELRRTLGRELDTVGRPGPNRAIGTSVVRWWWLHLQAWNTGVLGPTAQQWSGHLSQGVPAEYGSL